MWRNLPVKAVANGEPTYENIGRTGRGAGWWQGHEAWLDLTAGGTMGVVYGAASLWQWRLHANEPDHADWCTAPNAGWREALDFEGSRYPGIAAKIFDGLPLAGMEPNWIYTHGRRGLAVPGKLFVLYLPEGGGTAILSLEVPRFYRVFDPRTGEVLRRDRLPDTAPAAVSFEDGSGTVSADWSFTTVGHPAIITQVIETGGDNSEVEPAAYSGQAFWHRADHLRNPTACYAVLTPSMKAVSNSFRVPAAGTVAFSQRPMPGRAASGSSPWPQQKASARRWPGSMARRSAPAPSP